MSRCYECCQGNGTHSPGCYTGRRRREAQPDLFAPPVKPRTYDERRLVEQLRAPAREVGKVNGMTPERMRRCFPPRLPRVTVADE